MYERFQIPIARLLVFLGRGLLLLFFLLGCAISPAISPVWASAIALPLDGAIARVDATDVKVSLGSSSGELKFFPDRFEFVAGRTYKLILDNPSSQKHYFTSKDFADASWTRKVEAGNVEVKGAVRELELKPAAEAEWVFVPMKPGTYKLRCTISGHAEAGMTGEITIAPSQSQV
ncbi:biphenyl 2,3-dioxygenase [Oscillatoriales cyanobacterium LEGE 11467]|uniref:Biphenyl 2,3-dioxygenase n=1 Tax=Zarconia navalis LEGE 11467 TaxID=1828826 RepID=A0A928Z7Z2_9CYAN|nr:sulfocyanin-like copper-binding protein [Zarconia navalis]MBE9041917.1 biphenyl 2,3-dioxygenase [Zarconia navalis LEGE 11467]